MSKIRLLILLLVSYYVTSCSIQVEEKKYKLAVGYIEGEYDGLLLSNQLKSHLNSFDMFDKRYRKHEKFLTETAEPSTDETERIYEKLNLFLDIISKIGPNNKLIGRITKGIPSQSKIAPIWKPICEGTLPTDNDFQEKIIRFYTVHANNNLDVMTQYTRILTQGGDNKTTFSKINQVHEYIRSFD